MTVTDYEEAGEGLCKPINFLDNSKNDDFDLTTHLIL